MKKKHLKGISAIAPSAAFIYGSAVSVGSVVLFFISGSYFKDSRIPKQTLT